MIKVGGWVDGTDLPEAFSFAVEEAAALGEFADGLLLTGGDGSDLGGWVGGWVGGRVGGF